MIKVYIGELLDLPVVELIRPNLNAKGLNRWAERYVVPSREIVQIVQEPREADVLLVPHNYNFIKSNGSFIKKFEDISTEMGKKIIVFFPGDSDEEVSIKNAIVFRNSQYKSNLRPNEIILPGYVEDLGKGVSLQQRFRSSRAIVGFCGWADYKNLSQAIKGYLKNAFVPSIKKQGLWWRKRIIERFKKSKLVESNFIIRKSYSGNEKTIEIDPFQAKKEYVENIRKSDFTICVKGDGNFSTRFFEVLSLGRIPLLIDTDAVLPLEDVIDYKEIVLRVKWQDVNRVDKIVADFYAKMPDVQLLDMQLKAREVFEKYLRLDSYLIYVFESGYIDKYIR